ncbi:MAG: dynamin family protein [Carnobacterium sp.]|nr:dynamin family protein [Carnobacterium sp.]
MFGLKKELKKNIEELANQLSAVKQQTEDLTNQLTQQSKIVEQLGEQLQLEQTKQDKMDQLNIQTHYQLERLLTNYSDDIKTLINQRIKKEIMSTDVKGNIVRYQDDMNQLFPISMNKKILVTSTMSAGKSTVINALVGKEIVKARNEATTGKIYHILSSVNHKLESSRLEDTLKRNLADTEVEYMLESSTDSEIYISTVFNSELLQQVPLEIIDTPGINFSLNPSHKERTIQKLKESEYDLMIYVINATQQGVIDDKDYLMQINSLNSRKPILFVLNKLDEFDLKYDSVKESYLSTIDYLKDLGFEYPVVLPLSAYTGLLSKKVLYKIDITEYESDDFKLFAKKFNKYTAFNLDNLVDSKDNETNASQLLKNSGLNRLEKNIYRLLYQKS